MTLSLKARYDAALRDLLEFEFAIVPQDMAGNLCRLARFLDQRVEAAQPDDSGLVRIDLLRPRRERSPERAPRP